MRIIAADVPGEPHTIVLRFTGAVGRVRLTVAGDVSEVRPGEAVSVRLVRPATVPVRAVDALGRCADISIRVTPEGAAARSGGSDRRPRRTAASEGSTRG